MSSGKDSVIFFDLGGTLLYFDGEWPDVFAHANKALFQTLYASGLELDRDAFLQTFQSRLSDYYAQREADFIEQTTTLILRDTLATWGYADVPDGVLRPALDAMYAVSQSHWLPEEETVSTLESIQSRGIRMGLISNAGDDTDVQVLVDKARLRPFFEIVLSSAACGIRKPNPQIFHLALEQMNASPEEAYMVGDTLRADILGASNANIFSIWITRRADNTANRSHAVNIVPDATIEGLAELPPLLDKII